MLGKMVAIIFSNFCLIALSLLAGPVILIVGQESSSLTRRDASPCTNSFVAECIDQLLAFNELNKLRFVQNEMELEHFCSVVETGYKCMKGLYDQNMCFSEDERALFPVYEALKINTYGLLCNGSFHRQDLFKSSVCFMQQRKEIAQCFWRNQVPEIPILDVVENGTESPADKSHRICCSLERFMDCSKMKINATCGALEGKTIAWYIKNVAGLEVKNFCLKHSFRNYTKGMDDVCKSESAVNDKSILWTILILFVIFTPDCAAASFGFQNAI